MALQSDQEFAPTQIARAVFPTAFRGYDQDAVRRYLSRLAAALEHQQEYPDLERLEPRTPAHERVEELEDEIGRLRRRNEELEEDLARAVDDASAMADRSAAAPRAEAAPASAASSLDDEFDETRAIELLGKETARVLESARSAAADITKRAESSAETMRSEAEKELSDARRDANALVAERQSEAEALVAKVAGEAEAAAAGIKADAEHHRAMVLDESSKILADAETEAEAEQRRAGERAHQVVADAEALRQQVISELVSDRRQAQSELDRIKSSRDRLAMSLSVARAELDEVAEALEAATGPMSPPDGEVVVSGDNSADQAEVDRLIADLDSAPPAVDAGPETPSPDGQAGAGNGRGNRRTKGRNRKGAGKQAKGAGGAKNSKGPAEGTAGDDGFTVPQDGSPSPEAAPAQGATSSATAGNGQAAKAQAGSDSAGETNAAADASAEGGAKPGGGAVKGQGKRSGRNRSRAKQASVKSNGAAGADSATDGSSAKTASNGSGKNGVPAGKSTGGGTAKRRSKAGGTAPAAGEPMIAEDVPTAPIFEDVSGRFDELKGGSDGPAVESNGSAAAGVDPDEASKDGRADAETDAVVVPERDSVVIDLTDGAGEADDGVADPAHRATDGSSDGSDSTAGDGDGGGLVTVVAVDGARPSGTDAARADVSIRERSLVDGFTTIDMADPDPDPDPEPDPESEPESELERARPADGSNPAVRSTKAELDAETDLGIETGVSADQAARSEADGGPSVVRSVVVSEPSAPEQVITTVASRTASSQPDRTRGDLLMETPFVGRLPKEFAARDLALTRSGPNFRRQLRRALNDDQSDVLDRIRAGRGQIKVEELPGFGDQIDLYLGPLRRGLAEVAQSGAKAAGGNDLTASALDNLVRQLARYVVDKVRVPTIQVIEQSPDHDREKILEPIRALYREFRNVGLVDLADDALYEAFAIGLYDAIEPSAPVMWMVDPRCDPDPICEINRDRIDMVRGDVFPSGHVRPLSLPGCRCLVALAEY